MNRLTAILTATALAAAGLAATDAPTATWRTDRSKVWPASGLQPLPKGVLDSVNIPDCPPHFQRQQQPNGSYTCNFDFTHLCGKSYARSGTVNMAKTGPYKMTVSYLCIPGRLP